MQVAIRNLSPDRALTLCVWHASNPLASDGDSPWLDETGAPANDRARNVRIEPGGSTTLDVSGRIAISLEQDDGLPALLQPLARMFGRADEEPTARSGSVEAAIVNRDPSRRVGLRQSSSAAFPFKPLRESVLAPGSDARFDVNEEGVHLRIAAEGTVEFERISTR